MNKILKVNTRTNDIRMISCSEEELYWGGRSFIAHHFLHNVNPLCDPFGRNNKLIIASGLLGDTPVTTAGRLSLGGKSPLTGGIKESNVGGAAGKRMARLGLKAVLLEDAPDNPQSRILFIKKDHAELIEAPEIKGKGSYETLKILRNRYGDHTGLLCIGPAGEMGLAGACVATTDRSGVQLRVAGRGGMGAVMGSKGIKAVVFDDGGAKASEPFDRKALAKASREVNRILREDPKTENRHNFGTPAVVSVCNALGILPTGNFRSGQFEQADAISGETIADLIDRRGGEARKGLPCVEGCVISCSNVFADPSGKAIVASLQYENIGLLGSNCGIGDVDAIAELNYICNDVGLDTIETGAAIGVAMEAGIINFGDAEGAKGILRQVGEGTPLGRIIGSGVVTTGRVLGVRGIPAVKGQAIPAYDPRALKGIGVTYAMSPMGADHTAGNALETAKSHDPLSREGQIEISFRLQIRAAFLDSAGVCLFIRPVFVKDPSLAARLLNARYGWDWSYRDVRNMAIECLSAEREFNRLAGVSDNHCDVPEFMRTEPLPPNNTVFDLPKEKLDKIWKVQLPEDVF
ncbi:MAG: aldehyde ferredoxin oxidoreductase [Spirochaetes bacterium]|nr:MAG: aldehyde ferredoxin oxidoreductase [Spirochaetota bacterium]